ncbi:MAG: hypothetical protein K0Q79_3630 [Flavipsychrobacter sp.]|jgi:hypothetical protein|nr:hypothetical protein [Flavipsychrobacter sp.]
MNIYRITYIKNEVALCKEVNNTNEFNGIYHYEHDKGNLIYAIVKAENEENALTIAMFIAKEVKGKFPSKNN